MRPVSASVSDRAKHDQRYFANAEQASTASPLFDLSFVCVHEVCVLYFEGEAIKGNADIGTMDKPLSHMSLSCPHCPKDCRDDDRSGKPYSQVSFPTISSASSSRYAVCQTATG